MQYLQCYCCSGKLFKDCCAPFLIGKLKPDSAEKLMRSRYSAFASSQADYLIETTHFSTRKFHQIDAILDWAKSNNWQKLEVLNSTETTVEFKAYFTDVFGQNQIHHELSTFIKEKGLWFYVDGEFF